MTAPRTDPPTPDFTDDPEYFPNTDYERGYADGRAALSEATTSPEATLDVAWREAEAALPDGWYFTGGSRGHDGYRFVAALGSAPTEAELRRSPQISGIGPTPAAALLTLAARLRGPA